MDEKNSISHSAKKGISITKSQKDLAKKLEMLSGKPIEVHRLSGIVYLVVDCSSSMAEGNKMDQAKKGALGFAYEALKKGYSIGLIGFASYAEHILEPQNELARLEDNVERMIANGSTNMAHAIRMATDKLADKAGERVICLVTDGMPDDKNAALDAANEARGERIGIMTIGVDDADKDFLEEIATQKELSIKVSRHQLEQGIVSMAKLLPGK